MCVRELVRVQLGERQADNIDDCVNKRCCTAGILLALQTRQLVRSFVKTLHAQIHKKLTSTSTNRNNRTIDLVALFKANKIYAGLQFAFATGNWGMQKSMSNQTGVCQIINDTNILARMSHLRQVNRPLNRDGKSAHPRQLDPSQMGIYCAAETPEDKAVGLLQQLAPLTRIRNHNPSSLLLIDVLFANMNLQPLTSQGALVLVNGIICGRAQDVPSLVQTYRLHRQHHAVPVDSSISYNGTIVQIFADQEACYRPLLRCDRLSLLPGLFRLYGDYLHLFWNQLLIEGVIE